MNNTRINIDMAYMNPNRDSVNGLKKSSERQFSVSGAPKSRLEMGGMEHVYRFRNICCPMKLMGELKKSPRFK